MDYRDMYALFRREPEANASLTLCLTTSRTSCASGPTESKIWKVSRIMPTAVCTVSAFKEELNMSKKEKKPRMIPDVPATPIPGKPGKKRSNFDPTPRSKS